MIPLQIVISILQWLTPYLIKFIDKHTDDWLELLYDKIGKRFVNKYCKLSITVVAVDNPVKIKFNTEDYGDVYVDLIDYKKSFDNFKSNSITLMAEGYRDKTIKLNIEESSSIDLTETLEKEKE